MPRHHLVSKETGLPVSSGDRRWAAPALAAPDLAVPCAHAPRSSPAPRPPALAHLHQSLLSQDGLQALPCHPDQADSGKASRTKGRPQAQPALSSSSSRLKGLEARDSLPRAIPVRPQPTEPEDGGHGRLGPEQSHLGSSSSSSLRSSVTLGNYPS